MKLPYQLATISYCPDLTDPDAVSIPIAVLAVGKAGGTWSAAAVGLDAKRLGLDPLSAAMLADVPHMIRRHVDTALKQLGADATPATVIGTFHESLKTSIHVSAISEPLELDAADPRHIAAALFDKAFEVLQASLAKASQGLLGRAPRWAPRVAPETLLDPAPEQMFWVPQAPAAIGATAATL